jgi:carbamoyl-phosphate synthase large subunit
VFSSVNYRDKHDIIAVACTLAQMGYRLLSTRGTARALRAAGVKVEEISKLQEGRPNRSTAWTTARSIWSINTPSGKGARTDEGKIRAAAVMNRVTCITTLAAVEACKALRVGELTVKPLQDWYASGHDWAWKRIEIAVQVVSS